MESPNGTPRDRIVTARRVFVSCALIVGIVGVVTYLPGLKVGFFNGWWYLEWVSSMDVPRYLVQFFDPKNVTQGYRPVQGLYVLLEYTLFQFNSDGWLLSQLLLHAANGILLFAIVERLARNWRLAFVAALIFVVSPVFSLAIFWHAVVDPLSAFFYLLTLFLWIRYLRSRRFGDWLLTFLAFIFALFSKEIAVFLPLFLFLIEWWLDKPKLEFGRLVRQYSPFFLLLIPFAFLDLNVQSHGEFAGQFGFKIGPQMLGNLFPYLAVLTLPVFTDRPAEAVYYVWMSVAVLVYLSVMIYRRSTALLFLGIFAVLNVVPLLGFPLDYYNTRYLYTSSMVSAIVIAALVERGWQVVGSGRPILPLVAGTVAVLVLLSGLRVADAAAGLAEYTRVLRVPFRDIARQHPAFPADTYVYFVYPITPLSEFEGLFYTRYFRAGITVDGTDSNQPPALRSHAAAYVYYFDSTGRPIEIPVFHDDVTRATPPTPATFRAPIVLEGYTIPSNAVKRGQALVVMLTWNATAPVEADYSVFAHLIDSKGQIVAEQDGPPQRGKMPTSAWKPGQQIVDAIVLPLAADAKVGDNFHLELGLYDSASTQRVSLVDKDGGQGDNKIVIDGFSIVP